MHCMGKYRMNTGTWKNVLLFLAKVSKPDINEELRKENEYLKAEIDIYRKQLEHLGRRPKFTDGMRMRLVEKALALGGRMRDVVTIVRPDTGGEMTKHSSQPSSRRSAMASSLKLSVVTTLCFRSSSSLAAL